MTTRTHRPGPMSDEPFAPLDPELERRLRELDPAADDLTADQRVRRDALLEEILGGAGTSTPDAGAPRGSTGVVPLAERRARRRRTLTRRVVPLVGAAALTGVLVVGNLPGQGGEAYATWTQEPTPLTGETLATASDACVRSARDSVPADDIDLGALRTVLAEQRGAYTLVALAAENGSTFECFATIRHPDHIGAMSGSVSDGTVVDPALAPESVEIPGAGITEGPEGAMAFTSGRVGREVTAVTLHGEDVEVRASVANGHMAAWWPVAEVPAGGTLPPVRIDVTLADGTVRRDVPTGLLSETPAADGVGPVGYGGGDGDDGPTSIVTGRVGEDVTGVSVHTAAGAVEAEVRGGSFFAEWPTATSGAEEARRADITLRDGTVLRDVPLEPAG